MLQAVVGDGPEVPWFVSRPAAPIQSRHHGRYILAPCHASWLNTPVFLNVSNRSPSKQLPNRDNAPAVLRHIATRGGY
jgi:hypothetical protein